MSFRIEQKFRLTSSDSLLLKSVLFKRGLAELYPQREIQSTYFENKSHQMFKDSEEGNLPRKKIRIRHYPLFPSDHQLEIKTSSVEGRFKTARTLDSNELTDFFEKGIVDTMYGLCKPLLTVSYLREYFSFKDVRVTFDSEIQYWRHEGHRTSKEFETVCEIKAPSAASLDFLATVIPHPNSRFSKYGRACLAVL